MEQRLSAEENDIVIRGFTQSKLRTVLSGVVIALSGGLAALLFYWFPKLRLYGTCVKCPLETATKVLVEEIYQKQHKSFFIKNIKLSSIDKGTENVAYQHESTRTSTIRKISRNGVASEAFEIHFEDGYKMQDVEEYRHFESKKCTYIWDERFGKFNRLAGLDVGTTCAQLHAKAARLPSSDRQRKMIAVYGSNDIIVPVKSVFQLFVLEFFNPFYMFQLFTIGVWIAEAYYYYCIAIVIMTTFGITTSIIQTRRNQTKLRNTLEGSEMVTLLTGSGPQQVESSSLAPGDVILLPPGGCKVPADAALLCGSCVVNEGMLTGESVPVAKTAMPMTDETFNLREHAMHIIYCGTQVIQTRYYEGEYVRALILKTGYLTTKGQLVRSILYPLPADFKFDRDSYKFIIILTVIAFLGLTYTVVLKSARQMTAGDVILKSLDILTIVIPPALPAAMTVGRLYAVSRLKMANIFCMNTRAINVCGSVNLLCFDKTGTLTEDGLDMWGVIPMESPKKYKDSPPDGYVSDTNHNSTTRLGIPNKDPGTLDEDDDLKIGMNVCHNLTILNGELSGDPLELIMFQSTGWILEEPTVPDTTKFDLLMPTIVRPSQPYQIAYGDDFLPLEVGVVHQYPFSSSLQRSCVIAKVLGDKNFRAYCKGAPEMISSLCKPSTIPTDLNEELVRYAKKGYRVIAMASKSLGVESITKMQRLTRDEVEKDLTFLGLIIMENKLKPVTTQVITELKHANIRIVMITGDNIHTAQSVALDCGILSPNDTIVEVKIEPDHYGREIVKFYSVLSEIPAQNGNHYYIHTKDSIKDLELGITRNIRFVMSGPTWKSLREISPQTIPDIIVRGAVFARMTSDQKQQLVMEYQKLGYYVAMCGDGANDCGALRAAHTGISLSQHESSVAAPFTSSTQDISCIPVVIREGRAALTTSFGCFKFIVAYSLTQFFSVALLYYSDSNLTDLQFLYIDLVLIIVFAFMFGNTKAYAGKLYRKPPPNALLGFVPLLSLGFQLAIIGTFQVLSYFILTRYDWYEKHVSPTEISYQCWENYAVFSVSMFQYIALAICFSHGYPFRKSLLTNIPMMVYIVVITIVCAYIVMTPAEWLRNLLELEMPIGYQFRCIILVLASINFAICIAFERITIQYLLQIRNYLPNFLIKRSIKQTPYLALTDKSVSKEFPIIDANKSCELILKNGISHAVDMANHEKTTNGL